MGTEIIVELSKLRAYVFVPYLGRKRSWIILHFRRRCSRKVFEEARFGFSMQGTPGSGGWI